MLGNELTTVGEADDSIEKRKESQGDEGARRWIEVSARSDPRGSLAQPPVTSKIATSGC